MLTWGILFASNTNALAEGDDPVRLSTPYVMNLVIDYKHCKATALKQGKEIVLLTTIIANEKERGNNLSNQNRMCVENYNVKKKQAEEWKKVYEETAEELSKAQETPIYKKWYVVLLVGIVTGVIIP